MRHLRRPGRPSASLTHFVHTRGPRLRFPLPQHPVLPHSRHSYQEVDHYLLDAQRSFPRQYFAPNGKVLCVLPLPATISPFSSFTGIKTGSYPLCSGQHFPINNLFWRYLLPPRRETKRPFSSFFSHFVLSLLSPNSEPNTSVTLSGEPQKRASAQGLHFSCWYISF